MVIRLGWAAVHSGGFGGDLTVTVQRRRVGGGPAGIPAFGVAHPAGPVIRDAVAEHLIDRVVDGLVPGSEHRQQIPAWRLGRHLALRVPRSPSQPLSDPDGVRHQERLAERPGARPAVLIPLRPGPQHRGVRLHEQRGEQQLNRVETGGETDHRRHPQAPVPHRTAPVGPGDLPAQLRLRPLVRVIRPTGSTASRPAGKPITADIPRLLYHTARHRLALATSPSNCAFGPSYGLSAGSRRLAGSSFLPAPAASSAWSMLYFAISSCALADSASATKQTSWLQPCGKSCHEALTNPARGTPAGVGNINVGASEFGLVERLVWLYRSQPDPKALVRAVVTSSSRECRRRAAWSSPAAMATSRSQEACLS